MAIYLVLATSIFAANPSVLQSLRFIVFDAYQRLWPAPALENAPVRVVAIDEDSLARLGQWPWPRATLAELTDALGADGARAIVFDMLFAEPDRTSPEQMLNWLPAERAATLRGVIARWPTHDGAFAAAIARHPVVLGVPFTREPTPEGFPVKAGLVMAGDDPSPFLANFGGLSSNLPALTDAARGVGFINWLPDRDQVVRRVPLLAREGDAIAPSLVLEALRVAEGGSTYVVRSSNASGATAFGRATGVSQVRMGDHAINTDANSAVWIHFRPGNSHNYISAWRVLRGGLDPAEIAGKIIVVGATAPGLMDVRSTPVDAAIPGAEIHAQMIEQILANRFLTRPDFAPAIEWLIAIAAVLLLAFAAPRLSAGVSAMLGVVTVFIILGGSAFAFVSVGYLFDPVFPGACAFLFAASSAVYLYRRTETQRAEIRRAFSQYVSPSVVRQLAAHPERLALGGEVRDLTLMFCDVRNFTGISEGLSAERLTALINALLTPLTDIIIEHDGTIDKYMGDAIMAFWNAPTDDSEHARHACEAAQRIVMAMGDLNRQWRAEADADKRPFKDIAIGIGVNSGDCCVGNLGSHRRFDYSAIGDNVNITSRLEGLTKVYGLALIVGEDTARRLPDMTFLEVDLVRVKGRSTPSRIFTLLSLIGAEDGERETVKVAHEEFLSAYRAGRWDDAGARLTDLRRRSIDGLSGLYEVYEKRIAELATVGGEGWDGVYDMEKK